MTNCKSTIPYDLECISCSTWYRYSDKHCPNCGVVNEDYRARRLGIDRDHPDKLIKPYEKENNKGLTEFISEKESHNLKKVFEENGF